MGGAPQRAEDGPGVTVLAVAGAVVLVIFAAAFFVLPEQVVDSRQVPATVDERAKLELQAGTERDKLRNDVRAAALQGLGVLIVALGAYFTLRQIRLSRSVHQTDAFSSAIGHLQSPDLVARLGGIRALERLAKASRFDHESVVEVLSAFVHERAPAGGAALAGSERTAVQAAARALGRLDRRRDAEDERLDLTKTNLAGLNLANARLQNANLHDADLRGTRLFGAQLEDALLSGADLRGAALYGARCRGASFEEAHLEGADLAGAVDLDPAMAHCGPGIGPH